MNKRENRRKREQKKIILERNIYIISSILLLNTIIINFLNIIYEPYLINGIILEINLIIVFFCIYTLIKKQQQLILYENKNLKHNYDISQEK